MRFGKRPHSQLRAGTETGVLRVAGERSPRGMNVSNLVAMTRRICYLFLTWNWSVLEVEIVLKMLQGNRMRRL